ITKTLVIAGEAQVTTAAGHPRGALLRAYDKATGKDAGTVFMPAPQSGSPMTYMLNGKQYIIVAIGGGNYAGELLAFPLPGCRVSLRSTLRLSTALGLECRARGRKFPLLGVVELWKRGLDRFERLDDH